MVILISVMLGNAEQQHILDNYLEAILRKNEELNLTAVQEVGAARILHLEDSLAGVEEVNAAPEGRLVDLGSGGGFPGVPLAVLTGREVTLVDSTQKKMAAVAQVVSSTGITNVDTFAGRIEDLSMQRPGYYSVATARALASLPILLELASPLLTAGGRLIAYKSSNIEEELDRAKALEGTLALKHCSTRSFFLSDNTTERSILVFEKTGEPTVALPRRNGLAQKRPLA